VAVQIERRAEALDEGGSATAQEGATLLREEALELFANRPVEERLSFSGRDGVSVG
jgi:hypothetical protein